MDRISDTALTSGSHELANHRACLSMPCISLRPTADEEGVGHPLAPLLLAALPLGRAPRRHQQVSDPIDLVRVHKGEPVGGTLIRGRYHSVLERQPPPRLRRARRCLKFLGRSHLVRVDLDALPRDLPVGTEDCLTKPLFGRLGQRGPWQRGAQHVDLEARGAINKLNSAERAADLKQLVGKIEAHRKRERLAALRRAELILVPRVLAQRRQRRDVARDREALSKGCWLCS
mmetsp:Transcript_13454/g.42705  ORF Transcript_13454/g.42705 Transcript_13454/m.42705 type:complete len:231 (-) Transcript_13454:184-876(-)